LRWRGPNVFGRRSDGGGGRSNIEKKGGPKIKDWKGGRQNFIPFFGMERRELPVEQIVVVPSTQSHWGGGIRDFG